MQVVASLVVAFLRLVDLHSCGARECYFWTCAFDLLLRLPRAFLPISQQRKYALAALLSRFSHFTFASFGDVARRHVNVSAKSRRATKNKEKSVKFARNKKQETLSLRLLAAVSLWICVPVAQALRAATRKLPSFARRQFLERQLFLSAT